MLGRDHSGQGLCAKDRCNNEKRSRKITFSQRRKVRFQRINDWSTETVSSTDTEVVNHVSMWKNRVWLSLFIPCLCGFLSDMMWANSLQSCKTITVSYFLIIIWWQTLYEGRRRTSSGDKPVRGFCLSAAVHEPSAAVHTLFTVLG